MNVDPHDAEGPSPPPVPARPVDRIFIARPASVGAVAALAVYPQSSMSRLAGFADLVVALPVLFGVLILLDLSGALSSIAERFPQYGMLWSNVVIGAVSITVIAIVLALRRQSPRTIGLSRPRLSHVGIALAAVPACYLALFVTGMAYFMLSGADVASMVDEKRVLLEEIPAFSVWSVMLFGVFTGLHEELLFRGLLLNRFNALARNRVAAILLSALLFGVVHDYQGVSGMLQTGAIGLVLGIVATMSRSLWPAIFAHAAFNSIQFAILPYAAEILDQAGRELSSMPA